MATWTASFLALVFGVAVQGAEPPPSVADVPRLAGLRERWRGALEPLGVPGFAVAVVEGGELLALDAFGVRNPAGDPVDADTMYYIASCTKTFTAAALAHLAREDHLGLDTTVRSQLPRFELAREDVTESLTVRDLLCHRPGINSFPIVFLDAYTGQITEDRYYHWLAQVEPSGAVEYTNVHFTLAGRVLEAVTGQSWKDALDEHVFRPAGMSRTSAYASRMYGDDNAALPMEWTPEGFVACATRKSDRTMHAAGGTGTSARDAARWLALQLANGELDGKAVFAPETVREMRTRHSDSPPRGQIRHLDGFGLAWMLGTYRGRPYATHGGGYVGTAAHMSFLPEDGFGVAVLANASPAGQALCDVVSIDVYDRLLGEEHGDLLPSYIERMTRARNERTPAPEDDLVTAGGLSLATASYAGEFAHADWGELTLTLDAGELRARLGDLHIALASTGTDTFAAHTGSGDTLVGRFILEATRVRAVELSDEEEELILLFERAGG